MDNFLLHLEKEPKRIGEEKGQKCPVSLNMDDILWWFDWPHGLTCLVPVGKLSGKD